MYDAQELLNRFVVAEQMDPSDPSVADFAAAYIEGCIESLDGQQPADDDTDWSGLWTWAEADYLYRHLPE